MNELLRRLWKSPMVCAVCDILWIYVLMEVTRLVFLWENIGSFRITFSSFMLISHGGLLFDTSAIMYVNALWLILAFLPLHLKERPGWWKAVKWTYVVTNSVALLANLCDTVFYGYRHQRSTMSLFTEFGNEGNIARIIGMEVLTHWYLLVLLIVMIWSMWKLFRNPGRRPAQPLRHYYLGNTLRLGFWVAFFIFGVRGCTFSSVTRPIAVGYAQRFATNPEDVDLVLNTPFAILRTTGSSPDKSPEFFSNPADLAAEYSPDHPAPADSAAVLRGHNVVFLVLESFSAEYSGLLNPDLEGGQYKGYMPFLDSLMTRSVRFERTYSNSGFSIDALPSLLASTPRMKKSFVVSPYSLNHVSGIGELLERKGYSSSWFLGADNESLGIQGFTRQAGMKEYYGKNEYVADSRFGGMKDFDGTWGIWDGKFLKFFRTKIGEMRQPFVTGIFTITNHHPLKLPEELESKYPEEKRPNYRTVRYTDDCLREFFAEASREPWFDNTLFVISADHAYLHTPEQEEYNNLLGHTRIPIILHDPSGKLQPHVHPGMMQQIDVLPTLLGLLGYDRPFFAFGRDVFADEREGKEPWAFRWDHTPQIIMGDWMLVADTETWQAKTLHNFVKDPLMKNNLAGRGLPEEARLLRKLHAIVQTYSERQLANKVFK